ncbi:MAG: putative 6-pyruvoyl tetrahydropterin synthase [Chthonomonadales bacterium]|nr:putative 6-pyruvoyl tetrahydropterin synthase [Chthonomonadales bacterium]
MLAMTRRVLFSAAHADWLPEKSDAENEVLFGPNATPEPYGNNYYLDVTVTGEIDPMTGIIVNIKDIDQVVREQVVEKLDRKFVNRSVAYFCERPVTPETLLGYVRAQLQDALPPAAKLTALRLEETPLHFAEWQEAERREERERGSMLLTRVYEFAASHRLHSPHLSDEANRELFGKCNYPHGHGHNYILEVTVAGPIDAGTGRVCDETALDACVNREVVDRYDHRHFNYDIPEFADLIPSTEVVTKMIWDRLKAHIPAPARLYRVVVRETARNIFEYRGEENGP